MRQPAASYSENGDAMRRASWRSLFLGQASANFFRTAHDVLKILPHPGLRFALNASPSGRRRALLRPE